MKISNQSKISLEMLRHSCSHLMAAAVLSLFPEAKFGVGPAIENGFYYDLELDKNLSLNDLSRIEKRMKKLISQNLKFEKKEITIDEATKLFQNLNQPYKIELLRDIKKTGTTKALEHESIGTLEHKKIDKVNIYQLGNFIDLCRGPHVESTKNLSKISFKLTKLAGAYWRGDEKNKMLIRIYGLGFEKKEELDEYLENLAEAEKRDHRKLGKELDLFVFSDLIGPGLPIYTPKGTIVRNQIVEYSRELQKKVGYHEVYSPNMNKAELFKVSGHYEKYKDDMISVHSHYTNEKYYLKPMNCPQHTQLYASKKRSYRDLPIRYNDFANLYRDEKPGELSGLTRLRFFSQDDGHAFCREDQIKEEFLNLLGIVNESMQTYNMEYRIRLGLWDPEHPEKYLGEKKIWGKAQKMLEDLLIENKVKYIKEKGEAAIYGPKMDLVAKDSLGREFQISTIQIDLIMPRRFGLTYTDQMGKEKTPVLIHRAIIGSPERLMGILIEHYAGAFPVWLSPIQVYITPVGKTHHLTTKKIAQELKECGIRTEIDLSNETISYKIRKAETQKIPYIIVIGDKEIKGKYLNIRARVIKWKN